MRAALDDVIRLVACPELIAELQRVLERDRFRRYLSIEAAGVFVDSIQSTSEIVSDPEDIPEVSSDPSDDYLIALARREHVNGIISGDDDLVTQEGPPVLTPKDVLDQLLLDPAARTLVITLLWNLHLRMETFGEIDDPEVVSSIRELHDAVRGLGGDVDTPAFGIEQLDEESVDVRSLSRSQRSVCAYALELDRRTAGTLHAEHLDEAEQLPLAFEVVDRYAAIERLLE